MPDEDGDGGDAIKYTDRARTATELEYEWAVVLPSEKHESLGGSTARALFSHLLKMLQDTFGAENVLGIPQGKLRTELAFIQVHATLAVLEDFAARTLFDMNVDDRFVEWFSLSVLWVSKCSF